MATTGCATPSYKEPSGESIATIDFIDESSMPMSIYFHSNSSECTDRTIADVMQPKTKQTFRVSTDKNLVFTADLHIPKANKLGGLAAFGGALGALAVIATTSPAAVGANEGCFTTIDFLPEVDRTYEFRINSDGASCSYQFFSRPTMGQQTDKIVPVSFAKREWIRPMSEAGPFCKKI